MTTSPATCSTQSEELAVADYLRALRVQLRELHFLRRDLEERIDEITYRFHEIVAKIEGTMVLAGMEAGHGR
jgi:hypothetical protein